MRAVKPTRVLVISDLHLGGAAARDGKPAFQICTQRGRASLTRFIRWAATQRGGEQDVHLVIAGDIVDFLAEERGGGFRAFTADDRLATEKLAAIIGDTVEVWRELRAFAESGAALTLMLGNHDLELSFPGPRRLLLKTIGPGLVDFIYDNQAFTLGKLLVEHGNRYDDWNAVPHDDLREARARASRGEPADFDPLPGSRMVVELVNPTKAKLGFIDLLKPEDAALAPFLALLAPDRFKQVVTTLKNRVRALRVRYGTGQQPKDRNYIALERAAAPITVAGTGDASDDALLALAEEVAAGGDAGMVASAGSFFDRWRATVSDSFRERQLDLLHKVLRVSRGAQERAFAVDQEQEKYLAPATESAGRGYDAIVYGHTHLPKRVPLFGRRTSGGETIERGAVYLNSGTWADLMAVPRDALCAPESPEAKGARQRLASFASDLAANRLDAWRRQFPTFVRIDLDGDGGVREAALEVLGAEGAPPVTVTTATVHEALQGG